MNTTVTIDGTTYTLPLKSHRTNKPIEVELVGQDGNAFGIMGRVGAALRSAGLPAAVFAAYQAEATSGDYHHLLQTTMRWVETS